VVKALKDDEYLSGLGFSYDDILEARSVANEALLWLEDIIEMKSDGRPFCPMEQVEELRETDDPIESAKNWISEVCENCKFETAPNDTALTIAAIYVIGEDE
jgi:hypothetical protein